MLTEIFIYMHDAKWMDMQMYIGICVCMCVSEHIYIYISVCMHGYMKTYMYMCDQFNI